MAIRLQAASARLADQLAAEWSAGRVTSVTWLNHHSALAWLRSDPSDSSALPWLDYVGLDGLLLTSLLGCRSDQRTSADLVLPRLLRLLPGARIALVGTRRPSLDHAAEAFTQRFGLDKTSAVVDTRDGYTELPTATAIASWLERYSPNVVIVGLGSGLQEQWALEAANCMQSGLVITCGGYLDQVHYRRGYYPQWAYTMRLNWAVRLARDPTRLWRRYTLEAIHALHNQEALKLAINEIPGFKRYLEALRTPTFPVAMKPASES